jgi:hypothetical protein
VSVRRSRLRRRLVVDCMGSLSEKRRKPSGSGAFAGTPRRVQSTTVRSSAAPVISKATFRAAAANAPIAEDPFEDDTSAPQQQQEQPSSPALQASPAVKKPTPPPKPPRNNIVLTVAPAARTSIAGSASPQAVSPPQARAKPPLAPKPRTVGSPPPPALPTSSDPVPAHLVSQERSSSPELPSDEASTSPESDSPSTTPIPVRYARIVKVRSVCVLTCVSQT